MTFLLQLGNKGTNYTVKTDMSITFVLCISLSQNLYIAVWKRWKLCKICFSIDYTVYVSRTAGL